MQYLQIMDRGALSLVFSPVDSSAALGVEGVSEQESGSSKRISRRLSRRGSETKSEEVFAAVASEVVKLSKEDPEPAAVDLKENRENSDDAALAVLGAEIAALEPADSAAEAKDLHGVVPSEGKSRMRIASSPATGSLPASLPLEAEPSEPPADPTCLDRCVGDVSFVGRHRPLVSVVTAAYFVWCVMFFWLAGENSPLGPMPLFWLAARAAVSAVLLGVGGLLYAAWLLSTSWWVAWGDGAEQMRVHIVHPMRNPLLNACRTLAVGFFAVPPLVIIFLVPYGVLRLLYSAVSCTTELPAKKRRPGTVVPVGLV